MSIKLVINNSVYEGWTKARLTRSIENVTGSFSFSTVDSAPVNPVIRAGSACKVLIDNSTELTGYIDNVQLRANSSSSTVEISGRGKTADLVDCTADLSQIGHGSWDHISFEAFANIFCRPFGIVVRKEANFSDPQSTFTVDIGETVFDILQKAAKSRAVLLTSNGFGDLVLSRVGNVTTDDPLILGENITDFSAQKDIADRFHKYYVKNQVSSEGKGFTKANTQILGQAIDRDIRDVRTSLIVEQDAESTQMADARASWEAQIQIAQSERYSITVPGFEQSSGALWRENMITPVRADTNGYTIDTQLLITSITYSESSRGRETKMELKRKNVYAAQPEILQQADIL
jgi:prophage tail gpP-like protein